MRERPAGKLQVSLESTQQPASPTGGRPLVSAVFQTAEYRIPEGFGVKIGRLAFCHPERQDRPLRSGLQASAHTPDAGKAGPLKRPLGELFSRELALLKRFVGFFRRKTTNSAENPAKKSKKKTSPKPSRTPKTGLEEVAPAASGKLVPEKITPRKQASGKLTPPLGKKVSPQKSPAPQRRSPTTSPHQRPPATSRLRSARKTPSKGDLRNLRKGPLNREIAHSPADPFASTVGSVVFHLVLLLLILPLWSPDPVPDPPPSRLVIRYLPREEPKKEETNSEEVIKKEPETPIDQTEPEPVETPPIDEISQDHQNLTTNPSTDEATITLDELGGDFSTGRTGGGRSRALAIHGGNTETESAIQNGIEWLLRHQSQDGSWSPDRFSLHCRNEQEICDGAGYPEHRAGISALCLLALLGNGHPPSEKGSPRERSAWLALEWLLEHQDSTGCIRSGKGESPRNMYDHGIATFALCEAAQLLDLPRFQRAAHKALQFIAKSQQPGGGWDYVPSPTLRNDLSITGWQVLALHAGRKIGHLPPPQVVEKLERYLQRCIDPAGGATYSDRGRGKGRGGYGIDAVGLLSRLTLGHSPYSRQSMKCAQNLVQHLPAPEARRDWDREPQSMYYWYTATLALFHMGGESWDLWNSAILNNVLPLQHTQGELRGSWDPDPNWIGKAGGRVTQTALGILTFETYFRYTPLHLQLGFRR